MKNDTMAEAKEELQRYVNTEIKDQLRTLIQQEGKAVLEMIAQEIPKLLQESSPPKQPLQNEASYKPEASPKENEGIPSLRSRKEIFFNTLKTCIEREYIPSWRTMYPLLFEECNQTSLQHFTPMEALEILQQLEDEKCITRAQGWSNIVITKREG